MSAQRIIIAFIPRFLREALKRIIDKAVNLQLVAVVGDPKRLYAAIENTEAQWIIMPLCPDGDIPFDVNGLLHDHPTTRILAIAADASQLKIKSRLSDEEEFSGRSLDDLISLLRRTTKKEW